MSLRALMGEICVGVEIYYTGRMDGEYLKTAFVLCDDYTELTAKLWLLTDNPRWSDRRDKESRKFQKARENVAAQAAGTGTATPEEIALVSQGGRADTFKNYSDVLGDVRKIIETKRPRDVSALDSFHTAFRSRRDTRNNLFHSATFLNLHVSRDEVVRAYCDLIDYGNLLFGADWQNELRGMRQFETLEMLLRLESKGATNPRLREKVKKIFQEFPINDRPRSRGWSVVQADHDLHLRLCVLYGESELKNRLKVLLDTN